MKNYTVRLYQQSEFETWNAFIDKAKNATFLFHRDFMEYHSDRFSDFSLVIEDEAKWIAVLPANVVDQTVFSHQGLTYGGLVYDEKLKLNAVIEVFASILKFLHQKNIKTLQLKLLPSFYASGFAEELNYALFLAEAKLIRRDTNAVINLKDDIKFSKIRIRGIAKAKKFNLILKEEVHLKSFWNKILIPNLKLNYKVKPVHSLEEIQMLQKKFSNNIRQFNVYYEDAIVAGATIFETKRVAHAQYISGNETKGALGSLDFLFYKLITEIFKDKCYFDFGISNEHQGRKLNLGLSYWKESFGANIAVQDFYEVETANYPLLENVIL